MADRFWRLADGVHAAAVNGDLVFLDLGRDAYSCLPGVARSLDLPLGARALGPLADSQAEVMLAAGLVDAGAVPLGPRARWPLEPVTAQVPDAGVLRTNLGEQMAMVAAALAMARGYHGRPLAHLVDRAERLARKPADQAPPERLTRRVRAYRALLPWVPAQEACVYRCFLLLHYLHAAGLQARWVFGVRTWPFSAHCWLQAGEIALDDPADYLSRFTPILVV
jgi:hypothetical protein